MMDTKVGAWGLCPIATSHTEDQIHPDDFAALRDLFSYGKVFYCMEQKGDYLILNYDSQHFRVKPDFFQVVPSLSLTFGQKVRERDNPECSGIIRRIEWHTEKGEPLFYLEVDGKMKSKRYFQSDLEPCNA